MASKAIIWEGTALKNYGVIALFLLGFLYYGQQVHAETAAGIPLDKQVDLNLPQKNDPLTIKKTPVKPPEKKPDIPVARSEPAKVSFDGL